MIGSNGCLMGRNPSITMASARLSCCLKRVVLSVERAGMVRGMFVIKQVPAHITSETIPNMQSLPQTAKDILMKRQKPCLKYTNQMLIINQDGRADSWVPSSSDVFAEDWELVTE